MEILIRSFWSISGLPVGRSDLGAEGGGRKTEDGGRKTEEGGRETEDGGRKTEDGGRMTEDRWAVGSRENVQYPMTNIQFQ